METMLFSAAAADVGDALGALGAFGVLVFILLCIILPISAYGAQKWAYKCYKELQRLNRNIQMLGAPSERGGRQPE